jgi:hypothetical protein
MTNPLRLIPPLCLALLMRPTASFADDAGEWFAKVPRPRAEIRPLVVGAPL